VRLPADLPLIRADATLLEQALGNVMSNAAAHTSAGTRVVLDAEVLDDTVVLRITDDGPGIATRLLPQVFDKFARGDDTGTGLGLAIAKGIMTAHGGAIAADSPVDGGRGTRITLTFPREQTP
jgi:two-component system sensor histidine kinase KdpD